MISNGPRPYETNALTRPGSLSRKTRRHYYQNLASVHIYNGGVQPNLNCTINTYNTHPKFHSQADDHSAVNRKFNYAFLDMETPHEHSYNQCKYDRKTSRKMSSSYERNSGNSLASTASSESDSNNSSSSTSSELSGFRIVHEGKVVHNEIEEELDSPSKPDSHCKIGLKAEDNYGKFAASVLVTGPSVKDISIPSFL